MNRLDHVCANYFDLVDRFCEHGKSDPNDAITHGWNEAIRYVCEWLRGQDYKEYARIIEDHFSQTMGIKKDIHVVPQFAGEASHKEASDCWCDPEWVNKTESQEHGDSRVWVHNRPQ